MQDLISREAAVAVVEKELQEERASLIGNKVFLCTVSVLESVLQEIRRISTPWISVKDRLPDRRGYYLCHSPKWRSGGRVCEFWPDNPTGCQWLMGFGNGWQDGKITHWMPFPDAPTE